MTLRIVWHCLFYTYILLILNRWDTNNCCMTTFTSFWKTLNWMWYIELAIKMRLYHDVDFYWTNWCAWWINACQINDSYASNSVNMRRDSHPAWAGAQKLIDLTQSHTLSFRKSSLKLLDSTWPGNRPTRAPCGLRGCKNGPAPFPGRISYKATKPGLVCLSYLSILYYCIVVY